MLFTLLFLLIFLLIAMIDLKYRKIPNILLLAMTLLWGIRLLVYAGGTDALIRSMSAAALGIVIFLSCSILTRGKVGMGDVKLAFVMGLWLASDRLLLAVLSGFLVCAAVFLCLCLTRREHPLTLPLAPFLFIGTCIVLGYGSSLP